MGNGRGYSCAFLGADGDMLARNVNKIFLLGQSPAEIAAHIYLYTEKMRIAFVPAGCFTLNKQTKQSCNRGTLAQAIFRPTPEHVHVPDLVSAFQGNKTAHLRMFYSCQKAARTKSPQVMHHASVTNESHHTCNSSLNYC